MDAILVFPSMPQVMRLNKLGTFSMAQLGQSKSAVASFMKKKRAESGSGFEDGLLKLIRTLPAGAIVYPTGKQQELWWEVADENDNVGWVLNTGLAPSK